MDNFFSKNVKYLRKCLNLTQSQLSKKIKKDYSTIGKWENGTRVPTMEDTINLAEILNVSVEDLIYKNLSDNNTNNNFDEYALLFSKYKELNEEDKELIANIIETRKKQIDKEFGEE